MNRTFTARGLLLAGVSIFALSMTSRSVLAQSVDYGSLEQLYGEPVTTSATGKPQKVSEVPANMEIITQDDIRRSGADNIPDILRFVTGLDVRRNGFADAAVSVRGYSQAINSRLLVLLNGRQVYLDDYGYVPWQTIPVVLDEIRQIEVVKGPSSALFGFNAVGGVVNIITYDPLFDNVNAMTARTGTQSLASGSVVGTLHSGSDVGVRASAGGYMAHEYANPYTAPRGLNPEQGFLSADSKVRIIPGVFATLSATNVTAANIGESSVGSMLQRYYRTNSIGAAISGDTPYGTMALNVYRNELKFDSTAGNVAATNMWNNYVYVVQASDVLKLNADHTIRTGLEYRNNSLDSLVFINRSIGYQVFSGSGMWDWQINPEFSLTNAVRVDHLVLSRDGIPVIADGYTNAAYNNRTIDQPSYNSGLVYRPSEFDTLRITAARGVQVPSLLQFGNSTNGNPNLHPTVVNNYEFGYDRVVEGLSSVLRTAIFYQTNTDLIALANAAPNVLAPNGRLARLSNNIGSSNETGVEIGLKGHSESGFRWNASYTYTNVTEKVISNRGAAPDTPFDYMHGTPVHTVLAGIGYKIEKWEFDTQAKWQSEYRDYISGGFTPVLASRMISDYLTATARVGYALTEKVTLAVAAAQFNQQRISQTAAIPTERRVIASVTVKF